MKIVLIIGGNKEQIEKLCFYIKENILKDSIIVHPLYFLEFKREKLETLKRDNINNFKNIYCFNRVKLFTKNSPNIIIDNYIPSITALENLIYNFNVLNTPITHFICDSKYFNFIKNEFDNIFIFNSNYNYLVEYLNKEKHQIIFKNLIHPKKFCITVLFETDIYNIIFEKVKKVIKKVYNKQFKSDNTNFKEKIKKLKKKDNEFFLIFLNKRICYLFDLQIFTIYVITKSDKILNFLGNNCLLLKKNVETKISKLDFIIIENYYPDGTKSKKTCKHFENEILRFI